MSVADRRELIQKYIHLVFHLVYFHLLCKVGLIKKKTYYSNNSGDDPSGPYRFRKYPINETNQTTGEFL